MPVRTTRRNTRMLVAAAVSAFCIASFTACAAQPSSSAPETSSPQGQSSSEPDKAFQEWQLKFAECVRAEGVDLPDPNKDGQFTELPKDMSGFEAAAPKCEEKLGARPSRDGKSGQEALDEALKAAECLRAEGYDVEDPKPGQAMNMPEDVTDEALAACGIKN